MIWLATLFPKTRLCPATRMVTSPSMGSTSRTRNLVSNPRCISSRRASRPGSRSPTSTTRADGTRGQVGQVQPFGSVDRSVRGRYRRAVRIALGVSQVLVYSALQVIRERVLEPFGFLVDPVPGDVEGLVQEGFQEPVAPDDVQGGGLPRLGQGDSPIRLVGDPLPAGKPLEHSRSRSGPNGRCVGRAWRWSPDRDPIAGHRSLSGSSLPSRFPYFGLQNP